MKALAFGEILWDIDRDVRTLGGAPLNVLGHIARLGGEGSIISAVGSDSLGKETLAEIDDLGISREYLSISRHETGKALVALTDGIPSYTFTDPSAWDDITLTSESQARLKECDYDVFIFGTLASRYGTSRSVLSYLLENVRATEFFFDVNLRLGFYSDEVILMGLQKATIVKMNDEEVPVIAASIGVAPENLPAALLDDYSVKRVLITSGSKGSVCYEGNEVIKAVTGETEAVDTVGAGDSLSAAFLYFLSAGKSTEEALRKASLLADYVVSKRGAIPEYDDTIKAKLRRP